MGWNRHLEVDLPITVSMGPLPMVTDSRRKCPCKMTSKQALFKQCVTLSSQNAETDIFVRGRKGIKRECILNPLSCRNCLASKTGGFQYYSEELNSRVKAVCLPALSEACKPIPSYTGTAHE